MLLDPANGFVNNDLTGVAFQGSGRFSVSQKVGGIPVTGMSTIDEAKPIVESMISRGRMIPTVDRHAEVPFAKMSRCVAFVFQDFGESRFTAKQMHSVTLFAKDGIDSGADVITTGKEGRSRG